MKTILELRLFIAVVSQAVPLKIANVAAPAINCALATASPCSITVSDTVSNMPMNVGGAGGWS